MPLLTALFSRHRHNLIGSGGLERDTEITIPVGQIEASLVGIREIVSRTEVRKGIRILVQVFQELAILINLVIILNIISTRQFVHKLGMEINRSKLCIACWYRIGIIAIRQFDILRCQHHGLRHLIWGDIRWRDTHDHRLVVIKARTYRFRVHRTEQEISVLKTIPSPVHSVITYTATDGITMQDKEMSACRGRLSYKDHRTTVCDLVIDQHVPVGLPIRRVIRLLNPAAITEIARQRSHDHIVIGRCSTRIQVCLQGIGTILHQLGHLVIRAHVAPIKCRCWQSLTGNTMRRGGIGRNVRTTGGSPMIIHDLRHCRCTATRHTPLSVIGGQQIIIRCVLTPRCGDQRPHISMRRHIATCHHCLRMLLNIFDLLGIALQPRSHITRNLVHVKSAMIRITQNRCRTVITAHDHITLILSGIKHIVIVGHLLHAASACLRHRGLCCCQRTVLAFLTHKLPRLLERLFTGYFFCPTRAGQTNHC